MLAYTYRSTESAWDLYCGTYGTAVWYTIPYGYAIIVKNRCEFEGIAPQ